VKLKDIFADFDTINWESIQLIDPPDKLIAFQLDDIDGISGYSADDELVFVIDLQAHEKKEIFIYYGSENKKTQVSFDSDLKVSEDSGNLWVENVFFKWDLSNAEESEFMLKNGNDIGDSWESRIWTYAGQGHNKIAPRHDFHYQRRRFLHEVENCKVISVGSVRVIIEIFYNFIHFEENLNVKRTLIISSNSPVIEKLSTSLSGEPGIVLATMISKMGPLTLADGTFCGNLAIFPVNSPRIYPKIANDTPLLFEPEMNFQPISTHHDTASNATAAHKTIHDIDGLSWGAVWNPRTGQGKAEIAEIDDVSGFFLGWEQDRDASSIHPLTDRVFADFVFCCNSKRSFRHYSSFFILDPEEQTPHTMMNNLTKSIANPVTILICDEELADKETREQGSQSDIPLDLSKQDKISENSRSKPIQQNIKPPIHVFLNCPFNAYLGEEITISAKIMNDTDEIQKGEVEIYSNEKSLQIIPIELKKREQNQISIQFVTATEGKNQINARYKLNNLEGEEKRTIQVFKKPHLPFIDFCERLKRPEKRTLHGNLLRYWGGQLDLYWEEIEHESLGFKHAWYFDGKSWGSYSERDWEFWRREQTAFGSLFNHKSSKLITNPKAKKSTWEPGCLRLEYQLDGLTITEKKFIKNDVLADIISLKNDSQEEMLYSLIFKGKGHGMSEAVFDEEKGAIRIKNHAYAYTGLNQIFYASIPFMAYTFNANHEELSAQKSSDSCQETDTCYGNPVCYDFQFEFKLNPGELLSFTLGFHISEDYEQGYKNTWQIVHDSENAAAAVRWEWNHWFNDQVPRFHCNNEKYEQLYYYIYFAYRCNVYDVGKGWYKYPYVAPTSTTYFNTMFGWDSALHTMIGKWLRNPEDFVYGNQKNWSLVQAPCGFLPEIFGSDWRQPWTGGNMSLLSISLHEMYIKTGDLELLKFMYPILKKYEQWRACEIEFSPYWMDYHNNIPDYQERKDAFTRGGFWVDNQIIYYWCLADMAKWVGDKQYFDVLSKKAELSAKKFCMEEVLYQNETWDEKKHATHIGCSLYWSDAKYVKPERVKELLKKIFDPDIYGLTPPIPSWPINYKRPGDGWDHGDSVTTVYFTIEGLIRFGKIEAALKLLDRMVDISFIETEDGLKPTAPEYWDEKAKPWGCVEYAWQGLLTNLMIEHICGIRPNVPGKKIVVEPNFPEQINSTEISIPVSNEWIHFKQEISREKTDIYTLTAKNAIFDTIVRLHISGKGEVLLATIDGNSADYSKSDNYIEVTIHDRKNFTIKVEYM